MRVCTCEGLCGFTTAQRAADTYLLPLTQVCISILSLVGFLCVMFCALSIMTVVATCSA